MSILKDSISILIEDGLSFYNLVNKIDTPYTPETGSPNTQVTATADDEFYKNEIVYKIYFYTKGFIDNMNYNLSSIDEEGTSRFNKNQIFSFMQNTDVINNFAERIFDVFLDRFDKSNIISDSQIVENYVDAILNQLELQGWIRGNTAVVEEIIKYNLEGSVTTVRYKETIAEEVSNPDLEKILETLLELTYDYYKSNISK